MSEQKPSLNDIILAGTRYYAEQMRKQEQERERFQEKWFEARERQKAEESRYGHWEYRGTDHDEYWVEGTGPYDDD